MVLLSPAALLPEPSSSSLSALLLSEGADDLGADGSDGGPGLPPRREDPLRRQGELVRTRLARRQLDQEHLSEVLTLCFPSVKHHQSFAAVLSAHNLMRFPIRLLIFISAELKDERMKVY